MPPEINKDVAVLSLLDDVIKLLGNDVALAERVQQKLEYIPRASSLRKIIVGKRGDQPYYGEKHALALKPVLDDIIATRTPRQFLVAHHPRTSIRTIYLKIYQSWLWLIDNHPEKEKYAKLKEETSLIQRDSGVRIMFKADDLIALVPEEINPAMDNLQKLQNKITEFLEMDITTDILFDEKKLSLTEDQINVIKDSLAGLPNVVINIEPNRVRILRKFVVV